MEPLLRLVDVTKRHGGRRVLRGVSLDVAPGEVVGLIGENGVGKSTLVNVLSGSYQPDSGQILFEGQLLEVHSQSEAMSRGIGVIRQDLNVNPLLTVAQAVFRTGKRSGRPHEQVRDEAQQLMADHGFNISVDARLRNLSPLEKVLVEMARMAVEGARLVLMDEVGALFTRPEIDILHEVLEGLCTQGASAIYITHRLSEMKRVANRVAVLRDGRIEQVVNAADVSPEDMAAMLLTREQIGLADRTGHVQDDVALRVRGLTSQTLRGVDLDLRRGEVLGLTGPARKGGMHQLAEALSGRTSDEVSGDVDVADGQEEAIAYFSTEEQFHFEDSVSIARFLTAEKGDSSEVAAMREIIDVIKSMHIKTGSAGEQLRNLSGGDRQKVALKRWMDHAPEILILNHPTRGLDVRSRQDLYQMLSEHTGKGGSAILISADPSELISWCDRIAIMRGGRVSSVVDPEQVTEEDLDVAMVAPPARAMADDDVADGYQTVRGTRFLVG